jgi:selenocysteine-specific elongation factor
VTRSDLADPAPAVAESVDRLARTSLGAVEAIPVSGVSGQGLAELRAALDRLVVSLPAPDAGARVRFFVDRSFTIRGSGTVVTGTLGAGSLAVGDELTLFPGGQRVRVRELQCLAEPVPRAEPVARVAVNLRGVGAGEIGRGDALLTPAAWLLVDEVDVRLASVDPRELPGDLVLHLGSGAVPGRLRPLGPGTGRLRLARPLPLQLGDRAVLRDPSRRLATGLTVLDVEPPALRRRGAARLRGAELSVLPDLPDAVREVRSRGVTTRAHLSAIGALHRPAGPLPAGLLEPAGYVVDPGVWRRWGDGLERAVDADHRAHPLEAGLPVEAARQLLDLPAADLVVALVAGSAGRLALAGGRIARPAAGPEFPAEVRSALDRLRERLDRHPFDAPDSDQLAAEGLTPAVTAAAARAGVVLRLPGEILVHPRAAELAADALGSLPPTFTLSEARQALGTTRRVAVPLLEHLDTTGRTARVDGSHRRLRD